MRIAAVYDIHGNLPALEAVLTDIGREDVDMVVVGGDVVPGPMPKEVISKLLSLSIPVRFIHGNGERDVLAWRDHVVPSRVPERFHEALRWTAEKLPEETVKELRGWPSTIRIDTCRAGTALFCHATPRSDNELFTRITPEALLKPIFDAAGVRLVVCGHTHMQFDRMIGNVRVLNAGSVGMPFGEPGAYWLLLGDTPAPRRTPYDYDAANRLISETGYPQASAYDLSRPPSADDMLAAFEAANHENRTDSPNRGVDP